MIIDGSTPANQTVQGKLLGDQDAMGAGQAFGAAHKKKKQQQLQGMGGPQSLCPDCGMPGE